MISKDKRVVAGIRGEVKASLILLNHKSINHLCGEIFENYRFGEGVKTSEIDIVYINKKGIFVIEVKNWKGDIRGSLDSEKWTTTYFKGKEMVKNAPLNPVKQNAGHVRALSRLFNKEYPIYPLVVFTRGNAPKLGLKSVINVNQLIPYIDSVPSSFMMTDKEIDCVVQLLKAYKRIDNVSQTKHIQNIKSKYKD